MFKGFNKGLNFMPLSVVLIYILLFGLHIVAFWLLFAKQLPPVGRRLVILLYALHIVLIVLHEVSRTWSADWAWYFNFKFGEYNPSASFAATQYILVALSSLMIALLAAPRRWWHRAYWLLMAAVFSFLFLDEYMTFHEDLDGWELYYIGSAIGLMLLTALVYFTGLKRRGLWSFVLIFGGLGVAGMGGAGMEVLAGLDCLGWAGPCGQLPFFEESLENLGALTAIVGVLLYAWQHIPATAWQPAKRVILYGGLLSFVVLLAGNLIAPPLELRLVATPVNVEYGDTGMVIIGYYTPQTQIAPGDTLPVRLYWRHRSGSGHDFGMSLHLLSRPDAESRGQDNKAIVNPRFWQASDDLIYHRDVSVQLEPDAPTPGLYWLAVSLWQDPTQDGSIESPEYPLQLITATDRDQVSPETALLGSILVVDPTPDLTTTTPAQYEFASGLSLTGYSLALDADQLALQFAWESRSAPSRAYTQFVHLFDSEGNFVFGYDQPPFGGAFPTEAWPAGLRARDAWQVPLPEDLPPGEYHVLMGLYDSETQVRDTIQDAAGNPLQSDSIDLGWIER